MRLRLAAATTSILCLACGQSSTPSGPSAGVSTEVPPARLVVQGTPPVVGASSQFTATAVLADGSRQQVTAQSWKSSDTSVASVTDLGVVSARGSGSVEVSATYRSTTGVSAFTVTGAAEPPAAPPAPCPIAFDGLGPDGAAFSAVTTCGSKLSATGSGWAISTSYGHPRPFVQFVSPAGSTSTGEIVVTRGGATFRFEALDVYSSTTKIPYEITGRADSATVFTVEGTQGNTFGGFATIVNPNATARIDTLRIRLTNPAAPCCSNPMGVDNIVLK